MNHGLPVHRQAFSVVRKHGSLLMNKKLILISALFLAMASCGDHLYKEFEDKGRTAFYQKQHKGKLVWDLSLFNDSTFLLRSYLPKSNSSGTYRVHFTRYYFETKTGTNKLCDFYYYDSASKVLWPHKACESGGMTIVAAK